MPYCLNRGLAGAKNVARMRTCSASAKIKTRNPPSNTTPRSTMIVKAGVSRLVGREGGSASPARWTSRRFMRSAKTAIRKLANRQPFPGPLGRQCSSVARGVYRASVGILAARRALASQSPRQWRAQLSRLPLSVSIPAVGHRGAGVIVLQDLGRRLAGVRQAAGAPLAQAGAVPVTAAFHDDFSV